MLRGRQSGERSVSAEFGFAPKFFLPIRTAWHRAVTAGLLGCLASSLAIGGEAAASGPYYGAAPPMMAPAGYHIGVTPSGLPYIIPPGQHGGVVVWPYQEPPAPGLPAAAPVATAPPTAGQLQPLPRPPAASEPALAPETPSRSVEPPPPAVPPSLPEAQPFEPEPELAPSPEAEPAKPELVYKEGIYAIDEDFLLSVPQNMWRFVTAPTRFDRTDWLIAAAVAGVTGTLLLADEVLFDFWQDDLRGDETDFAADVFRPLGEFDHLLYGTMGAYAIAEVFDARREKAAALMALESLLFTAGLTQGMKFITGRKRPADTDNRFDFNGPSEDYDTDDSFFSGHASKSFAVATVIAEVYGDDHPWVPWIAYTAAGGTALSRVNDERHWFSDIFMGAAAGYFIGQLVTRFNPFLEEQGIGVTPLLNEGGQGLNFTYNF